MKLWRLGPSSTLPLVLLAGCFNPESPELGDTTTATTTSSGSTTSPMGETTQTLDGSSGLPPTSCGNGEVEEGEACDEAGDTATCDADCTVAECGDGYVNQAAGELCDDGNDDETDECNAMCMLASCGDGVVSPPEQCDDGNRDQTDDCVGCLDAVCGDGFVQAGVEECDDGDADDTDDCPSTCTLAVCGDGFLYGAVEECDDGNADDTDACLSTCVAASCGDGFVQAGVEECDDGNADDTDACVPGCVAASCGDGFVQDGVEECDDANGIAGDGCDNCVSECGTDCFGDNGCLTDDGRCIKFTCTSGMDSATACDTCFGWQPVTYDQWLNGGYCDDVTTRYRADYGTTTMCGGPPLCCDDPVACGGSDNAWHFSNGIDNYFVGPCLGCVGDMNCTFWNNIDNGTYTRITVCERP